MPREPHLPAPAIPEERRERRPRRRCGGRAVGGQAGSGSGPHASRPLVPLPSLRSGRGTGSPRPPRAPGEMRGGGQRGWAGVLARRLHPAGGWSRSGCTGVGAGQEAALAQRGLWVLREEQGEGGSGWRGRTAMADLAASGVAVELPGQHGAPQLKWLSPV